MKVHVLANVNDQLVVVDIIEDYYSLTWAERYSEVGDFELDLPIEHVSNSSVVAGNFLSISSSDKVMLIEDIKPSFGEEESSLLIRGQSSESILKRRVLLNPVNVEGVAEATIYTLVDENLTNAGGSRQISLFKSSLPSVSTTEIFEEQLEMQTLYDAVEIICKNTGLGFKVVNDSGELAFSVYKGEDRSYDQGTNPYVIFSDNFDNVIESSFYESEKDKINIVLVATNDIVPSLQRVFVWESSGSEPEWLLRCETVLETEIERTIGESPSTSSPTNITTPTLGVVGQDNLAAIGIATTPVFEVSTYIPPLSDVEVLGIINTRGRQVIEENKTVGLFEGDFDIQGNFKLGVDFFMGDIVQCSLEGRNVKARIIELVRSYSTEGETSYVAMDFII